MALILAVGCKRSSDHIQSAHAVKPQGDGYFHTSFQDESQYIVETIVSDLAEQMYYASWHRLPDPTYFLVQAVENAGSPIDAPVYHVTIALEAKQPDLEIELNVDGPIWSPEIYQGVTAALARQLNYQSATAASSADTGLLLALTDGKATTIEQKDQGLSLDLAGDFTNPALHEQAAVLLGAFTLREHSGDFYEIRSPLCRMTAHLAMAHLLAGSQPPSVNGRVAEAMLYTLMNDEAAAVEKLKKIDTNNAAVASWVRTLQADNTGDYRPLMELEHLSLIERIARFHAYARYVDTDIAWNKLDANDRLLPDFARIANEAGYSVEVGHQLLAVSLSSELKEIGAVYELARGKKLSKAAMPVELNEMPQRCLVPAVGGKATVQVIGWGQWAMFFQRQLGHAIQNNFDLLQNIWGVPDEAREFAAKCDQLFTGMRLYPFVRWFNSINSGAYHAAVDDAIKVTMATPQLTPAMCWNCMWYHGPKGEQYTPNPNPHINEWHKHNPPPGTAYNMRPRFDQLSLCGRPGLAVVLDNIHTLAPYDRNISYNLIRLTYTRLKAKPTCEQSQELYKAVLPYATFAMTAVAATVQDQPERYENLMTNAASLDPSCYYPLGDYFRGKGVTEKAVSYYEQALNLGPDSVQAASKADWLIKYYLKKGERPKAQALADLAGEVYSAAGLEAKAGFLEATRDYDGAFEWYAKVEERYGESDPLIQFCARYEAKSGDSRFAGELKSRISKLFPQGIEKVSLTDFQAPPTSGVRVCEQNNLVREAGMRVNDVIVAVNGIRIHSMAQYKYARETEASPEMILVVWQGNQYRELKANLPDHQFGAIMSTYTR